MMPKKTFCGGGESNTKNRTLKLPIKKKKMTKNGEAIRRNLAIAG
jgi:hypothetical protein